MPRPICCLIAVAMTLLCLALSGCESMRHLQVTVEPVALPVAAVSKSPLRVGVHFPQQLREASVDSWYLLFRDKWVVTHVIGRATTQAVGAALRQTFTEVVELPQWPAPAQAMAGLDAVIVPGAPAIGMAIDEHSLVAVHRTVIEMPLELHVPSTGAQLAWSVRGHAVVGIHGPLFTQQREIDAAALRSLAAAMIVSLQRGPAAALLRAAAPATAPVAGDPSASTPGTQRVALRLDAGLPREDGIERRIANCLGAQLGGRDDASQPTPAARLRDALFPWFDPGVAPLAVSELADTLAIDAVGERLRMLDVGELVLFTARDAGRATINELGCFGGFGAGACFGVAEAKESYVIDLAIWDVANRRPVFLAPTQVDRTIGALAFVLPVPYFYSTERQACERMRSFVKEH